MLQKNKSWPALLLAAGLSLIFFSFLLFRTPSDSISSSPALARVDEIQGNVYLLKKFWTQKKKISQNFSMSSLDTIETGPDGQAILEFPSAYRIRMQPQSLVTLEENPGHTLMIIKQGDIQVENFGREGTLIVSKSGRRVSATEYELEKQNRTGNGAKAGRLSRPTETTQGFLTQDDIQGVLQKYKPMFFKCYTQLLQKSPGVTGQATLAFTIEKSGKITQPEITNSSINDTKFQACLLEALARVEFKSFSGDPVSTVFPLRFE